MVENIGHLSYTQAITWAKNDQENYRGYSTDKKEN